MALSLKKKEVNSFYSKELYLQCVLPQVVAGHPLTCQCLIFGNHYLTGQWAAGTYIKGSQPMELSFF